MRDSIMDSSGRAYRRHPWRVLERFAAVVKPAGEAEHWPTEGAA